MIVLMLLSLMTCPTIQKINLTQLPWNTVDQEHLEYASKRCGQIYSDAPCLKKFYKVATRQYRAICGTPN